LELFVAQQVDLRILTLPEGLDPCDFLHQKGADAFAELLANSAVDALEHAFQTVTRGVDVERDVHGSSQAMERLISIVAKAPRLRTDTTREDRFREEKILQRLAAWFRVDETEVRRHLTSLRRRSQVRATNFSSAAGSEASAGAVKTPEITDPCQREFLELLLAHPECLPIVRGQLQAEYLGTGTCRHLYETCCTLADEGVDPTFDRLMLQFDEPAMKSLLVELDEAGRSKGTRPEDPQELFNELIKTFHKKETEKQRPAQITALREGGLDENRQIDMLEQILRQERNRQGITKPTDG
jgi:DNA primase